MTYKEKFEEVFGYNPYEVLLASPCHCVLCRPEKECDSCYLKDKTWDSEYCKPPKNKPIKVGDFVKVIDNGKQYTTYCDIFNKSTLSKAFISRFALGENIDTEYEYEVLEIIQDDTQDVSIAVLTSNKKYGKIYLVDTKGLKATKETKSHLINF